MNINGRSISNSEPTYFIADVAANHDGDIQRAKDLIFLAAEAGADAAKFQHFTADSIVSDEGFRQLGSQLSHQSTWTKSVFEVYDDASVSLDWTEELAETCKKAGIAFFSTPYNLGVIDYLDRYVPAYKIGSGDITWPEMLEKVAKKNKPTFLATGASTLADTIRAAGTILGLNRNLCIMQCNTNYTASLENFSHINLNVLKTYGLLFPDLILGLSDHTPGHATVLGAIALGARVVEKHFTDSNDRQGPDHKFSMNPASWSEMVLRSRELELSLGVTEKKVEQNELETVILQRRSIRVKTELKEGHCLSRDDLEMLRPCPNDALSPSELEQVLGKTLTKNMKKGDCLRVGDFKN